MCCYEISVWTSSSGTTKIYDIQGERVDNLQEKYSIEMSQRYVNAYAHIVDVPQEWFNTLNASKIILIRESIVASYKYIKCFKKSILPSLYLSAPFIIIDFRLEVMQH